MMNIRADAIGVSFGDRTILDNVSMAIHNNRTVGLIGPNGSGKSTFLKCVYRVLKPDAGKIYLNDCALDEMSFRESALQLAVVAQHNFYSFDFSVLEIVLMGRSPHKKMMERNTAEDYAKAREALRVVGLETFEERNFSTLSGGEQQRVILARALTQDTPCLVLDEPTNHLDIKYQLEIMDIVKALGITVVTAIHDLNIAAMYCDTIVALKDGKIVGVGTPEELLTEAFIYELYEVRSSVRRLPSGQIHVVYLPRHQQEV